jgi:CRP-like cAMP-binding protein
MVTTPAHPDPRTNRLLAALPAAEYAALAPHLTPVHLDTGATIYEPGDPIGQVYFPLTGIASVLVALAGGRRVEVGIVGREGFVGLPALLGADAGPQATLAQASGAFARLGVAAFRESVTPGTALYARLLGYTQSYHLLTARTAACNRLHPVEERCARWLLMTHDRAGADTFPLTRAYLGYMLGVRRPDVASVLATLQRAGLIDVCRGAITVRDRPGLEAVACACYALIAAEYDRLLG